MVAMEALGLETLGVSAESGDGTFNRTCRKSRKSAAHTKVNV